MWPFDTPSPSAASSLGVSSVTSAAAPVSACPVDPSVRSSYLNANPSSSSSPAAAATGSVTRRQQQAAQPQQPELILSDEREVSSIPRWLPSATSSSSSSSASSSTDPVLACPARSAPPPSSSSSATTPVVLAELNGGENGSSPGSLSNGETAKNENWIYPSPRSFYTSLIRKERTPNPVDMPVVVPIHNAVNERVWEMVLAWEKEAAAAAKAEGKEAAGESRLVSFVGRPTELSVRARIKGWIGYTAPFDRHDWIVDRPLPSTRKSTSDSSPSATDNEPKSIRIRYIIDFYTGRLPAMLSPDAFPPSSSEDGNPATSGSEASFRPNLSFYLDVRPAVDDLEAARMRVSRAWRNTLRNVGLQGSSNTAERA